MIVRPATVADVDGLIDLARLLDTMNLPHDPVAVRQMIDDSQAAFTGSPRGEGNYTLVAEDAGRIMGTATLIARHGTPTKPHYYLELVERPIVSSQLDVSYIRHLLRLGKDETPRTELSGLVVHPEARGQGLGKLLLAARLLVVAARPDWFCERLIAELLPPLREDGGNAFWDAMGGALTGMAYYRADRLCRMDKRFIEDLFPRGDVILELLPQAAQDLVGQVGTATAPIKALLERAGFHELHTIDPFDGGPHLGATRSEIHPIARSQELVVLDTPPGELLQSMVLLEPRSFHVVTADVAVIGRGIRVTTATTKQLEISPGDPLWAMPLDW